MRVHFRFAALAIPLSVSLIGCAAEEKPAESAESVDSKNSEAKKEQPSKPETPEEFLERAEEAMAAEGGWTFAVQGKENLVLQGQESVASYRSMVRRTQDPEALHSKGTIISKGVSKPEEIFVVDGMGYVKEGSADWKRESVSSPEMKNKVEDPVAAIEAFRAYAKESGDEVTLTERGGEAQLQVRTPSRKLSEVQDRAIVQKAVRELNPTLKKLQQAGVSVTEDELTLSRLEETLILDAKTYRIKTHRFQFGFLIPFGGQNITYGQDVKEENRGVFDGGIKLPASVN